MLVIVPALAVGLQIILAIRLAIPIILHTVPITLIIRDMIDLVAIPVATTAVSPFMQSVC